MRTSSNDCRVTIARSRRSRLTGASLVRVTWAAGRESSLTILRGLSLRSDVTLIPGHQMLGTRRLAMDEAENLTGTALIAALL
jgi:hypothetical protein